MHQLIILAIAIIVLNNFVHCAYVNSPVSRIKIPKRNPNIAYKGSVFSFTSNGHENYKSLRDYALENEEIKTLEERFMDHFNDIIMSKLAAEIKTGIPSMSIPPMDPLRLNEINVEPRFGNDVFTIKLNNVEVEGLSDVDVQDLKPKLNALKLRLALIFPKMTANCHFQVNGTLYNIIDVKGEGQAKFEYTDVLMRTQLNLVHENKTFKIASSDPPLVDFHTAKILLSNEQDQQNKTGKIGVANELGTLLFWVFADHVVQEIDQYLLKYINTNLLSFKVPESFNPAITWMINKGISSSHHQHPMFSPFPFLHQWLNSLSNFKPQVQTRFF